jgi:ribosome biogenesis GTPase / thiamine phosphate phosphatase
MNLSGFGLSRDLRSSLQEDLESGCEIARVAVVNRNNLELETDSGPASGEVTGQLRYSIESDCELPAVGDWVSIRRSNDFVMVNKVLPRTGLLRRRRPGDRTEHQLIAANVDTAFIVHACERPVHPRRLERYTVMAQDGGVEARVLLTKADLLAPDELEEALAVAARVAPPAAVSSLKEQGMAPLLALLEPGRTYVLLGPSGAGKTTILNRLVSGESFATGAVRASDGKGRHTTTRRHLVRLGSGALLIDTPGMRELGMTEGAGLDTAFQDIAELAESCRFRDCTHQGEAGCAVVEAAADGRLDSGRLANFLKLGKEAAHFERSALEKRHHDKDLHKMYRAVLKGKKDRR